MFTFIRWDIRDKVYYLFIRFNLTEVSSGTQGGNNHEVIIFSVCKLRVETKINNHINKKIIFCVEVTLGTVSKKFSVKYGTKNHTCTNGKT